MGKTTDGGYIIAGSSGSNDGDVSANNGNLDFWVVKLSPETSSIAENAVIDFTVYPNPTSKTFKIASANEINSAFNMIDAQGKEVLSGKMNGKEKTIDISSLTVGACSVVFEDSELPVLSVIKE
ncbi:MAG: T9SS type A sorting domain-containing protein [Bacteroidota bacterium]